ncbi:MAG: hypothetical protein ACT4OS_04840 [Acidimicrobiales bacterium]
MIPPVQPSPVVDSPTRTHPGSPAGLRVGRAVRSRAGSATRLPIGALARPRVNRPRAALAFAALAFVASSCSLVASDDGAVDGPPVVGRVDPAPPPLGGPPGGGDAQPVTLVPEAVDLRPRPFDEAEVLDDRRVALRFFSGVAPCDVTARVDIDESDPEVVTITLFSGRDPRAGPDVACIEIAVYSELVVELPSPLAGREIVDGAR